MELKEVISWYNEIINREKSVYARLNKTIFNIGTLRLIIVLAGIFGVYFLWSQTLYVVFVVFTAIVLFCGLLIFHNRLYKRRLYSEIQIKNAKNELKGINYDYSAFDGAPEKNDPDHSFSYDLDLFGNRSFFQSINRTVTSFGKDFLAEAILFPFTNKKKITERQEAIRELAGKPKLLCHFRTVGEMSDTDNFNIKDFSEQISGKTSFYGSRFWIFATYLVPALYLILFILYLTDTISGTAFIPLWTGTLIFSSVPMKKKHENIRYIR